MWALGAKSRSSGRELCEECRCANRVCQTFPYKNHLPLSPCGLTLPGCPARLLNEVALPFGTHARIRALRVRVAGFHDFGGSGPRHGDLRNQVRTASAIPGCLPEGHSELRQRFAVHNLDGSSNLMIICRPKP